MMGGPQLQSHRGQQSLAEKPHRKRHEPLDGAVSTCSVPGTDTAGSACVTSASVLCRQLQVPRRWELPSHRETCQGKRDVPIPGDTEGSGGAGGCQVSGAGRSTGPHRDEEGACCTQGRQRAHTPGSFPGCWRMSQAGGQATAISRLCSSLTLENGVGSKPRRTASPLSQSRQGRAQPARLAPALARGARGSPGLL